MSLCCPESRWRQSVVGILHPRIGQWTFADCLPFLFGYCALDGHISLLACVICSVKVCRLRLCVWVSPQRGRYAGVCLPKQACNHFGMQPVCRFFLAHVLYLLVLIAMAVYCLLFSHQDSVMS